MGRPKSIVSVDKKLAEAKKRVERLEKRLDLEKKQLSELIKERDRTYADAILRALKDSNKTIEQVMTFLGK